MPVKFEVSVMQVGASLRITIPKEIGKHLSLEKGNMVELWVDNHRIIMEKKKMKALKENSTCACVLMNSQKGVL